uniref:C-type lectin domain-containing protein n=1 Tax=Panagrolaimus davidi TaxID=227884 RepID=A0A914PVE7_9BILA
MLYFKLLLLFFVAFAIAKNDCPEGSFLSEFSPSNCYIFQKEKLNWNDAGKVCEKFGGHLAFPQNLFEAVLFGARASNMLFTDFWINFVNSSVLTNIDGSPFKYETWLMWDTNGPKNLNNQRCAAVTASSQKWKYSDCSDLKPFLCQIERNIPSNEWIPFNATGYQYKVFNYTTTWKIAQLICKQENSNLISIHSKQEMIFATGFL